MIEFFSTFHRHITDKRSSQNSTFEISLLKQLPHNTLVIHTNFKPVKLSTKLETLRLGPNNFFQRLFDVTNELLAQDGSKFHTHEYYSK